MKTVTVTLTILLLFAAVSCGDRITAPPDSPHFFVEKLSDGVCAALHTPGGHAICNAGIIDLGDRIKGDGDPAGLRENLEEAIALNPRLALPGHGAVGDVRAIREMIGYIDTLTSLVSAEIARGGDETDLRQLPIPEKFEDWQMTSFFHLNLTFLYNRQKPPKPRSP